MSASKVYFTDFRCHPGVSQLDKLRKLLEKSEFSKIDFDGKFVAIKLHFGELGNLSFLRANYAKVVADFVKERGGKPFLTDCNTLYVGSRKNALEHMDTAYLNGYSPFSTATSHPTATATRKTTCPSSPTSACLPPPTRSRWIWLAPRLSTASPSCRTAPSRTCSSSTTATASTPRMTTRTGRT